MTTTIIVLMTVTILLINPVDMKDFEVRIYFRLINLQRTIFRERAAGKGQIK